MLIKHSRNNFIRWRVKMIKKPLQLRKLIYQEFCHFLNYKINEITIKNIDVVDDVVGDEMPWWHVWDVGDRSTRSYAVSIGNFPTSSFYFLKLPRKMPPTLRIGDQVFVTNIMLAQCQNCHQEYVTNITIAI